ncbi:AraC family transcriptional regulator [Undibacterium sp. Jales W-56]|uniref:AraC family transcriptional regulator n=1 Tax=Undibacterium sp. Jales W-56 TaxID=2897325 RepID=UPI0021D11275|nr:AraC family transcriptional regulator [Undibacterium sp. Jales W-56]MCU6433039.1 AraC family transcriptional regulator [Undibacterium sp. Jales W-56]
MTTAAEKRYLSRFRDVFDYIDQHLDEELSVEQLSAVAAFSKYHFHRQFSEMFGISVHKYVQLVRLKRATYTLAFRDHGRIIDLAMASGYEGPEAFSRAFRKMLGQSPSAFKEDPLWTSWYQTYQAVHHIRITHMKPEHTLESVKVVHVEPIRVAVLEHRGAPDRISLSIRRFIEWRKQQRLSPAVSATFNIFYSNPHEAVPDDYRLDLCASVQHEIAEENEFGIVNKMIPGGRCAVLRHVGSDDNLAQTMQFIYSEWLPQSGEELRDFPVYAQRVKFFPDVPEQEAIIDVFLPIQ